MNAHQKAAHRAGERRVGRDDVTRLLELSHSDDADDRLLAASLLCPCHMRRPDEQVRAALHRMMEDPDVRVRRAAWHTIEDGGGGASEAVQAIADRLWPIEKDRQVRRFIESLCGSRTARQRVLDHAAVAVSFGPKRRGKCDFCGELDVTVTEQLDTPVPDGRTTRAALICARCQKGYSASSSARPRGVTITVRSDNSTNPAARASSQTDSRGQVLRQTSITSG